MTDAGGTSATKRAVLLAELEIAPHEARVRRMVALGQAARTDPPAAALVDQLATGSLWERQLALWAAFGSRRPELALEAAAGPTGALRGVAMRVVANYAADHDVLDLLHRLPAPSQKRLVALLRGRRRLTVVDGFVEGLDAAVQRRELLGYASPATVDRLLADDPGFVRLVRPAALRRLARNHPGRAAELLATLADDLVSADGIPMRRLATALSIVAGQNPDAALGVLRSLPALIGLSRLDLAGLAQRRPTELFALAEARGQIDELAPVGSILLRRARALGRDRTIMLAEHGVLQRAGARAFVKALPIGWRADAYARLTPLVRGRSDWIRADVAALLPAGLRRELALEHLGHPDVERVPRDLLAFTALLGYRAALDAAATWLGDPEPANRALAWSAVIIAVRYEPESLPALLASLAAHGNEPDPVRATIIESISRLPVGRFELHHLEPLAAFAQEALAARDCSRQTQAAAARLWLRLALLGPGAIADSARGHLASTVAAGSTLTFASPHLRDALSVENAALLDAAIGRTLDRWLATEDYHRIVREGAFFAARLKDCPHVLAALDAVVTRTIDRHVAEKAIRILGYGARELVRVRVSGWVRADPTVGLLEPVEAILTAHRQDLLDSYLGDRLHVGRFSAGGVHVVPIFVRSWRWTPRQQMRYADAVIDLIATTNLQVHTVRRYVDAVGDLSWCGPVALQRLSAAGNGDNAPAGIAGVRDAAISALGRWRGGDPLPLLTDMLDDDRARMAIYAMRRTLFSRGAADALAAVRRAPTTRVTVAKEVYRLAGALGTGDALEWLLDEVRRDVHRDVQVALQRSLWDYLGDTRVWDVLQTAADSGERVLAGALTALPTADHPEVAARDDRLWVSLINHPAPTVRADALVRLARNPQLGGDLVADALLDRVSVAVGMEQAGAAQAWATRSLLTAIRSDELVAVLVRSVEAADVDAARELISAVTAAAQGAVGAAGRATAEALVEALGAEPLWTAVVVAAATEWASRDTLVGVLQTVGPSPLAVSAFQRSVAARTRHLRDTGELARVLVQDSATAWAAPLALASAIDAGGWTDERREQLVQLRRHTDPVVAGAAITIRRPVQSRRRR